MAKKLFRKMEGVGRKNAGIIAMLGLAWTAILLWPESAPEPAESASTDPLVGPKAQVDQLLANLSAERHVNKVYVQFDGGSLEHTATVDAPFVDEAYRVDSTAPTGQLSRWDLYCGTKLCDGVDAFYQEPTTHFVVTVPCVGDASRLVATVSAAILEVDVC